MRLLSLLRKPTFALGALLALNGIGGTTADAGLLSLGCDTGCTDVCCDDLSGCDVMAPFDQPVADQPLPEFTEPAPLSNPNVSIGERFASFTGDTFAVNQHAGSYIDSAIVGNQMRFRIDSAYNGPLPDRAEFFYAQCGCFNPQDPNLGPALVETEIDSYQEFTGYMERSLTENFSAFVEIPFRLINPEVNDNTGGLSDIRAGFKAALLRSQRNWLTFQFKVYTPTGDGNRGLGTNHVSLEPGLLFYKQATDRTRLFGEFRTWIPISDNQFNREDYAGTILRYGLGGSYDIWQSRQRCSDDRLSLVAELVGWSITGGYALSANRGPIDVTGDTIINAKFGARYTSGPHSLACGYGRGLTGDVWYSDIVRLEYRYAF